MRDRVMGLENEFGVVLETVPKKGKHSKRLQSVLDLKPNKRSELIQPKFPTDIKCIGNPDIIHRAWFANGSCVYRDHGLHPEHSSGECRRVRDLVIANRVGEILIEKIYGGIRNTERAEDPPRKFRVLLFKNNLSPGQSMYAYATFGCHENYLVYNLLPYRDPAFTLLIPFFITRQILDGAGWWLPDGTFALSQRALVVRRSIEMEANENSVGGGHIMPRDGIPIIDGIKELQCTRPSQMRFHHISGDANMLDVALFLKFGTMHLVLALLEDRFPFTMPRCINAVYAMQMVSREGAHSRVLQFENGEILSALETQIRYWEVLGTYLRKTSFDSGESEHETHKIHRLWEQGLNATASNDIQWMLGRLDHATKKYLAERVYCRDNATHTRLDKHVFDIIYHGVSDPRVRQELDRRWKERRLSTDQEVLRGLHRPYSKTRMRLRGKFVSTFSSDPRDAENGYPQVFWDLVEIYDKAFFLRNPMEYKNDKFEKWLCRMRRQMPEYYRMRMDDDTSEIVLDYE